MSPPIFAQPAVNRLAVPETSHVSILAVQNSHETKLDPTIPINKHTKYKLLASQINHPDSLVKMAAATSVILMTHHAPYLSLMGLVSMQVTVDEDMVKTNDNQICSCDS